MRSRTCRESDCYDQDTGPFVHGFTPFCYAECALDEACAQIGMRSLTPAVTFSGRNFRIVLVMRMTCCVLIQGSCIPGNSVIIPPRQPGRWDFRNWRFPAAPDN
jgi:hypothetical protein